MNRTSTDVCFFMGESLIPYKCKNQIVVARSSTEAEYHAMATTPSQKVGCVGTC